MWQELLHKKYLSSKTLSQVSANPTDSPFWKGLMKVKDEFFKRGSFQIGNGQSTRFWEDIWLGQRSLASEYPSLYNIVNHRNVTVENVLSASPLNISFRRTLNDYKWERWTHLLNRLIMVQLSDSEDTFKWSLTSSGIYTVKSMYIDLLNDNSVFLNKYIWKMKVPLKIRIFMWFLQKKVILTKDNLAKRNWQGDVRCCFCDHEENIQHLFLTCPFTRMIWRIIYMTFNITPPLNITNLFGKWLNGVPKIEKAHIRVGVCAVLWAIWKVRNDCIFNKKSFPSFLQVIPLATHLIHMWSYLQSEDVRLDMDIGCNRLVMVARDFYNRCGWSADRRLEC
jgi:hypothetical protein